MNIRLDIERLVLDGVALPPGGARLLCWSADGRGCR